MCSMKTMIKIMLGIALLLVAGYLLFPQLHDLIVAVAPFLVFLACPVMMYFMMKGMNAPRDQEKEKKSGQEDK